MKSHLKKDYKDVTIQETQDEEVITIEVPWETIKLRFHLFFILSIVLLILPITFNIAIHIKFGFHPT